MTVKHDAARRIISRAQPTLVLHVGDHDPSGLSIFHALAEDVSAFVSDYGEPGKVEFRRVAVTEEQIADYGLPEAPAKTGDKRGEWKGGTVQVEALAPGELAAELRAALEAAVDLEVLRLVDAVEMTEREELLAQLLGIDGG